MPTPVVLGLDFGGSKVAAALADLDGERRGGTVRPVRAGESATTTFHRSVDAARALLSGVGPDVELVAVGACTFGIPREDGIDLAPTIDGWEALPFGALLRAAFPGAAIRTGTDVKAAAQAEAEHGALAGCDPGLYVNLGTGLAVAIVVGGQVVAGHHRASGEIGYNLRHPDISFDAERLEDVVSGKALAAAARDLLGSDDVDRLLAAADTDPVAGQALDRFVTELCFHLANLTIALDPQRVVVGGGLVRSWDRLRPRIAAALDSAVPFPPELVVAAHPYDAPLIGALALGASAARGLHARPDVVSEGAPA